MRVGAKARRGCYRAIICVHGRTLFQEPPILPHMGFQRMAGLVFGVALFCTIPFSLIRFSLCGDRTKAFALTDHRLLMTVGPRREDVRMVALMALAPVEVM